jgi:hypothetical protein
MALSATWFLLLPDPCWSGSTESRAPQTAGTVRMVQRLQRLASQIDPMRVTYLSRARAQRLKSHLEGQVPVTQALQLLPKLATDLLNSGESEAALKVFQSLESVAREYDPAFFVANERLLQLYIGVSHLRIGEQENCIVMHNADSCLLPIQGGGIHRRPRGSRQAIEILGGLLKKDPSDLETRWLLNLAYMTLGEYPHNVPANALIPPGVFESEYDIKRFRNLAPELGLDVNGLSGGSVIEDLDGDGLLDVLTSSMGLLDPLQLFRNNGDGTFTERSAEAGLTGLTGGLNLVQADYNNDGHIDVLVLRGAWFGTVGRFPNSLLRNNGNGTFADVTEEAGLLSFHPTQTGVWFDYNDDGWLDLFIGNESAGVATHLSELFRNNGDGTFTEVATEAGAAIDAFVKGVTAGDYNNDGRADLYLSVLNAPNVLLRNDGPAEPGGGSRGKWKFTDATASAGVAEPIDSFPTWFFDYDNDGWLDLFVAGYRAATAAVIAADYLGLPHDGELPRLYRNKGDGTFENVTREAGLARVLFAMGANYGDLDNDGYLDFYVGTGAPDLAMLIPNRMFRNAAGERFQDVTTSGGFGHLQKGHGVSFADLDSDGDQDVHADMGGAYTGDLSHNVLFENPGHGNHWVSLQLEGTKANRAAIGARIRVTVATPEGERTLHRVVSSGGSFGASPLRQAIGLGRATAIRKVQINWDAAGPLQEITGLDLDRFYRIRQGDSQPRQWTPRSFKLGARPL